MLRRWVAALAAVVTVLAVGCGGSAAGPGEGGRVVALDPFAAETLVALGVTPAAVPRLSPAPPALAGVPTIAVSHSAGPDIERLAALDPDLVISSPTFAAFNPQIEQLGIDVRSFEVRSLAELSAATVRLGAAVGRETQARRLAERYRRQAARAARGLPDRGPEVLLLFGTVEGTLAFLPDTYAADLVRTLGGRVISEGLRESSRFAGFATLTMEEVVRRDPGVIVAVTHGADGQSRSVAARLAANPAWRDLRAVRDGRVQVADAELFLTSPGPRVGEALRELRALMYG